MISIPAPTRNLRIARQNLLEFGLCCVADALDATTVADARSALYAAAAEDRRTDTGPERFALDMDANNQRVWNLLARASVFADLATHATVLEMVRQHIGWPALLSNISGNIVHPGAKPGLLHADQGFVAQPWPEQPQGINAIWCLDDFTVSNGATRLQPASHHEHRPPGAEDVTDTQPLVASAGTLCFIDSRLWHQTGANTTATETRAGIFAFYTTPVYRPQENWFLSLHPDFITSASHTLLQLLAYKTSGFGLVNGRSPR